MPEVPSILNGTSRHVSENSMNFNLLSNFVPEGGNGTKDS